MIDIIKLRELNKSNRFRLLQSLDKKGISIRTLEAMDKIPRELFIEENLYAEAYADKALPISCGQTISQPFTVAAMTDLLEVSNGLKVLEIGTGSGYQSLILALLGVELYTVERINILRESAIKIFDLFEVEIQSFTGDGSIGLKEHSPFDRIIVTAAAPYVPDELKLQLGINGILLLPVGDKECQIMTKIKRTADDNFIISTHNEFRFVPLIGKSGWTSELDFINN
ncbi:MAG: protein-L-isoaspartate(D-aspartate) O-methyltransferase [Candidatus Kapaibacterium sp.]|jgi:protein-L-isoaspartate(D-aspartate) O-methyltransferase|nr:protein-L-isoaspartate(D-aspartate) O-methyltransferase [Candidatus Kapabacteria bacterium]